MPPPRHPTGAALIAVLFAACTPPAPELPEHGGPSELTASSALAGQPGHERDPTPPARQHLDDDALAGGRLPVHGSVTPEYNPRPGRGEPAELAALAVIERLEAEGLYVLALTTSSHRTSPGRADVEVQVLHGTGQSHPTESRYRVGLERGRAGWIVSDMAAT